MVGKVTQLWEVCLYSLDEATITCWHYFRDIYYFISRRNPGIEYNQLHEMVNTCFVPIVWLHTYVANTRMDFCYAVIGKEMDQVLYRARIPMFLLPTTARDTIHAYTRVPCATFHKKIFKYQTV